MNATEFGCCTLGFPTALLDCTRLTTVQLYADKDAVSFGSVSADFSGLSALRYLKLINCGVSALFGVDRLTSLEYLQVRILKRRRQLAAKQCLVRRLSTFQHSSHVTWIYAYCFSIRPLMLASE